MPEFDKDAVVGPPRSLEKYVVRINVVYELDAGADSYTAMLVQQDILNKIPRVEGAGIMTVESSFWNKEGNRDW